MACKLILVVEDDDDIRSQVAEALEADGYRVKTAENGLRALEILKASSPEELPSCMIVDLMMPEMDGRTLLDTIARSYANEFGRIPVLISTARGASESFPGSVDRIQKPFDLDDLYQRVAKHCGRSQ